MFAAIIAGALLLMTEVTMGIKTQPCTCAAMDSEVYDGHKTVPMVEQSLNILPACGDEGSRICAHFCKELADKTRNDPEGANEFCKRLKKDISNVHVYVFSKACDEKYQFTGSKSEQPLCCVKGERVPCAVA